MIKHYCDVCGAETTKDNGVIESKELTIEEPGFKVSVSFEVDIMKNGNPLDNPVICASCVIKRISAWATEIGDLT